MPVVLFVFRCCFRCLSFVVCLVIVVVVVVVVVGHCHCCRRRRRCCCLLPGCINGLLFVALGSYLQVLDVMSLDINLLWAIMKQPATRTRKATNKNYQQPATRTRKATNKNHQQPATRTTKATNKNHSETQHMT